MSRYKEKIKVFSFFLLLLSLITYLHSAPKSDLRKRVTLPPPTHYDTLCEHARKTFPEHDVVCRRNPHSISVDVGTPGQPCLIEFWQDGQTVCLGKDGDSMDISVFFPPDDPRDELVALLKTFDDLPAYRIIHAKAVASSITQTPQDISEQALRILLTTIASSIVESNDPFFNAILKNDKAGVRRLLYFQGLARFQEAFWVAGLFGSYNVLEALLSFCPSLPTLVDHTRPRTLTPIVKLCRVAPALGEAVGFFIREVLPNRLTWARSTMVPDLAAHRLPLTSTESYSIRLRMAFAVGADPDVRDADGNTALMLAVKRGDALLVEDLLKAGAHPMYASLETGKRALAFLPDVGAISPENALKIAVALAAPEAALPYLDKPPLFAAIAFNQEAAVRALVAPQPEVHCNTLRHHGMLPLAFALMQSPLNKHIVDFLRKHTDPALQVEVLSEASPVLTTFAVYPHNIGLHAAIMLNWPELVQQLLEFLPAEYCDTVTYQGMLPLRHACLMEDFDLGIIEMILEKTTDIEQKDASGRPLFAFLNAEHGTHQPVIDLLLKKAIQRRRAATIKPVVG